ncbi:hypothetical protein LTR37_019930 [Vermiconidia calcicola]|uniref:Uncharacterized protein n=1 Tax=Vermiconidia calcicola TaxID=1690605 RepID=A0ACC3MCS2_9PEZI|nr:hypothetical protein LTR37_019930 [Vermiconidia calcicola]
MAGDLDSLVDMGFDREKAALALKKGGNLGSAVDWLGANADKSLEDLQAEEASSSTAAGDSEGPMGAASMLCNDCGKRFRNMTAASAHAEKTGHDDFAESSEALAPLTEEEKAAKLEELKQKLAAKRMTQAEEDKAAAKRNEEIRKKHTKEHEDAKEQLQRKEQMKEAAAKRAEKAQDVAAKKRIQDKIAADKAERKRKADEEKAMRANPAAYDPQGANAPSTSVPPTQAAAPVAKKATTNHSEARLRLQTSSGNVMKNFPAETTLFEVAHALAEEAGGLEATSFTQNFPKKVFEKEDFGMTLKEAGLVPSAALIVNVARLLGITHYDGR